MDGLMSHLIRLISLSLFCLEKQHNVGFGLQAGGLSKRDTPREPQKATLSGRMNSVDGL